MAGAKGIWPQPLIQPRLRFYYDMTNQTKALLMLTLAPHHLTDDEARWLEWVAVDRVDMLADAPKRFSDDHRSNQDRMDNICKDLTNYL